MTFDFILLFATAMIAGLLAFFIPNVHEKKYKLALVFAGAYLFSITILHILPELYTNAAKPAMIGVYVLIGFFLQQILEYFTAGAEHGHIHKHHTGDKHSLGSALLVVMALLVHSFLEGSLLAHPGVTHANHVSSTLLMGIVLHKAPAAFALMSILLCHSKKTTALIFLVVFSLGSPLGMLISHYYVVHDMLSGQGFSILFAIVSGSFLHISTTIVFESSMDHSFNLRKIGVALLGGLVGVAAEFFA